MTKENYFEKLIMIYDDDNKPNGAMRSQLNLLAIESSNH